AWRLEGGGGQIAARLADQIKAFGGEIRTNAKVARLVEDGGCISRVELESGEELSADWVISSAHPSVTLGLVGETKLLRKIYRRRIASLKNTYGMFTANICLKPGVLKYPNRNIFVHTADADLWRPDASKTESVLVHTYVPEGGEYATHMDILSPMAVEGLGDAYLDLKLAKAGECFSLAEKAIPGLSGAIERVFTSTPLTYQKYTGTPNGTAFGVAKDWMNPMGTILSPRTPIPNLLMTGQSLNLHGVLGVSMTSVFTSACILGMDALKAEILP
ncbi:MAG: FAD-dependent oxidoreductase, partial [Bacteroidales bacterium]|nr:FAD-dependent oxidoreductase [Bacteroidales bacterium]